MNWKNQLVFLTFGHFKTIAIEWKPGEIGAILQ
jgi:hypothetical protein